MVHLENNEVRFLPIIPPFDSLSLRGDLRMKNATDHGVRTKQEYSLRVDMVDLKCASRISDLLILQISSRDYLLFYKRFPRLLKLSILHFLIDSLPCFLGFRHQNSPNHSFC